MDGQDRRRARGDRGRRGRRVEVQRARVDVGEDRPRALVDRGVRARDERERRRDDLVAVASRRRRAARGAARRCRSRRRSRAPTPMRAANASSKAGTRGPSESWPRAQDLRDGRAPPRRRGPGGRAGSPPLRWRMTALLGRGDAAHAAGLLGVLERVDERGPRRGDEVRRDADRAPRLDAVGGVDEDADLRVRALRLVEDADLEVRQPGVGEVRVRLGRAPRAAPRRARAPGRCRSSCAGSARRRP